MLTHIVTRENRLHYGQQLHQMHVQRRQIFAEALGWAAMRINERGEEIDEYDDEKTNYLLVLDDCGSVQASLRMRPVDEKCMIFDHFPHLIEGGPEAVRHAHLWEGSRYLIMPHLRGEARLAVSTLLNISAVEFTLSRGVTQFLGMSDTSVLARNRRTGWKTRILGLPAKYAEGEAFAFVADVSLESVSDIRSSNGNFQACHVELPPLKSPNENVPVSDFIELLHGMVETWDGT